MKITKMYVTVYHGNNGEYKTEYSLRELISIFTSFVKNKTGILRYINKRVKIDCIAKNVQCDQCIFKKETRRIVKIKTGGVPVHYLCNELLGETELLEDE